MARGKLDEAKATIDLLERRRGSSAPEGEKLGAALTLRTQAVGIGGVEETRAAAGANPADLNLRFALAEALAAAGQYEEALESLLDLVERDRKGLGEEARKTMLAIFRMLEGQDIVHEYQRKLSAAMY